MEEFKSALQWFIDAGRQLRAAWEDLSPEDKAKVDVGYPLKLDFDEVPDRLVVWRDSLPSASLLLHDVKPDEESGCPWCGLKEGCDCHERMTCSQAGQIGHTFCGTHPCGCPKFFHLNGQCPKEKKDDE